MDKSSPLLRYSASDRTVDQLLVLHILSGDQRAFERLGMRWPSLERSKQVFTLGLWNIAPEML